MDLWDVVKLMVRRWYVSVPMLLLTVGAVAWTAITVTPNHTAETSVLILPATVEPVPVEGEARVTNPWDTDALASAALTILRSSTLEAQLAAEGYDASWEAGRDIQFWSVINIEVTSPTPGQAEAAATRLSEVVAHEVSTRQQGYGLTEGELVGTVTLTAGENIEVARGNQMRALIVVFFAGSILTVGLTIAVDAISRARRVRRAGESVAPLAQGSVTQPPAHVNGSAVEPQPVPAGRATGNGAEASVPAQHSGSASVPAQHSGSASVPAQASGSASVPAPQSGITIKYRGNAPHRPGDFEPPQPDQPQSTANLEDATIILPLSNVTPNNSRRKDRGNDAAGENPETGWR